jgi:hypothetical protein
VASWLRGGNQVGIMFVDDKERASGDTQGKVDEEVRALLNDSYARAKKVNTALVWTPFVV